MLRLEVHFLIENDMGNIFMRSFVLVVAMAIMLSGCMSVSSLPQSANDVNFEQDLEGKTGWSKYEEVMFFKGVDKRTAYLAAKEGIASAGFTLKKASFEQAAIVGEHGMTAYDWNVVAGVYIKEERQGSTAKVIVEGSKDIGFWGDMTAESWPQKILKGMKDYILSESLIDNPNKKHFQ